VETHAALFVRKPAGETSPGDLDHVGERDGVNDDPAVGVDDREPRAVCAERDGVDVAGRVGDRIVMLADASTAEAVSGPIPATVVAYVEDCDKVYQRALMGGATTLRERQDMFYGNRSAGVVIGDHWWVHTHVEDVSPEEMTRRARELQGS
jgi:hypothetical protein